MSEIRIPFEELRSIDALVVDCVYEGGPEARLSSEVLSKLLPNCGNMGGFRWTSRQDTYGKAEKLPAYIVLFTSMEEVEWPDYLDVESGVFHYYGDNRDCGKALNATKGNRCLERIFSLLHNKQWQQIPPILIFRSTGDGRYNVRFLGLAVPGNPKLSADQDLVAFWRSIGDVRFQNYEAYFTILDTRDELISKEWLRQLIVDHKNSLEYAPKAWRSFVAFGRDGIKALKAERISRVPSSSEQMPHSEAGRNLMNAIHSYYQRKKDFTAFEACAADIVTKMDPHFHDIKLTRPWRDGGRDAIAHYRIGSDLTRNPPLNIDCAIEAKCYAPSKAVGVREMSRLISRIRYRQFGILVTTGYVDRQAYEEVLEDGHPILIVTGADIAHVLHKNSITGENVSEWLASVENRYPRLS